MAQVHSALQVIPYFELWVTSFTGYLDMCGSSWSLVRQRANVRVTLQSSCELIYCTSLSLIIEQLKPMSTAKQSRDLQQPASMDLNSQEEK